MTDTHLVVPHLERVTPLGTCRISNPLRRLAEVGAVELNLDRIFGYVHSTPEILQQIRFLEGEFVLPPELVKYIGPNANHVRCRRSHETSQVYFVEISSRKVFRIGGVAIQSNHLARVLRSIVGTEDTTNFFLFLADGSRAAIEEILGRHAEAMDDTDRELLRGVSVVRQTSAELSADIAIIREMLPEKAVLVTHVGVKLADGRPLADRDELISEIEDIASGLGIPVYNPTVDLNVIGQVNAMDRDGADLAHYSPHFEQVVSRKLADLGGLSLPSGLLLPPPTSEDRGQETELSVGNALRRFSSIKLHRERLMLQLPIMCEVYLQEYAAKGGNPFGLGKWFASISGAIDADEFEVIRRKFVNVDALNSAFVSGLRNLDQKYLDFPYWTHQAIGLARRLGLTSCKGRQVLEFGSSPGYLGLVCRQLGHTYRFANTGRIDAKLVEEVAGLFGVESGAHPSGQGSLVVCSDPAYFQSAGFEGITFPWTVEQWGEFLEQLIADGAVDFHFSVNARIMGSREKGFLSALSGSAVFESPIVLNGVTLNRLRRALAVVNN